MKLMKPEPKPKTDPATQFWTVYRGVTDEHDEDLVSKYVEDLSNSLIFVSMFNVLAYSIHLNRFLLR